mmetsp:Transcript_13522/g.28192  ORF Transcript_13522/g.28192 Transcript_13522/m.28192 type:complete len:231 (+) Transcript_13522:899-1591(+)
MMLGQSEASQSRTGNSAPGASIASLPTAVPARRVTPRQNKESAWPDSSPSTCHLHEAMSSRPRCSGSSIIRRVSSSSLAGLVGESGRHLLSLGGASKREATAVMSASLVTSGFSRRKPFSSRSSSGEPCATLSHDLLFRNCFKFSTARDANRFLLPQLTISRSMAAMSCSSKDPSRASGCKRPNRTSPNNSRSCSARLCSGKLCSLPACWTKSASFFAGSGGMAAQALKR